MSMQEAVVMVPRPVAAPRGARWAGRAAGAVASWFEAIRARRATPGEPSRAGQAIWNALKRLGQRRAAQEIEQLARHYEPFDPARARALRALLISETLPA